DAAGLEERRRTSSPSRFARLWRGVWVEGGDGDALDADLLRAAVCLEEPTRRAEPGWLYAAGLGLGLTRDACALVVVGRHCGWTERTPREPKPLAPVMRALIDAGMADPVEAGEDVVHHAGSDKLRVCRVGIWRPPAGGQVDLATVEAAVAEAHDSFRLSACGFDPWQCAYLAQRAAAAGVPMLPLHPTPANLRASAECILEAVNNRQLETFAEPTLLKDLSKLRLVERQ